MKKKLKIKFWKAEKALAMQIIEQEGLPIEKRSGTVNIVHGCFFHIDKVFLRGQGTRYDFDVVGKAFDSNEERNAYFDKITQAITDELFSVTGEIKVGEMCEVRDFDNEEWEERELIAILPDWVSRRFIVQAIDFGYGTLAEWISFSQARPIAKRIEPKVEVKGEITMYTWEEK